MNNHKELIIRLIQQDMKHQQLVEAICKAGFETEIHNLQLIHIVANLMNIPPKQIPDRWAEIYINCLGQTIQYPITPTAENLLPLAEECYLLLSNINENYKIANSQELQPLAKNRPFQNSAL